MVFTIKSLLQSKELEGIELVAGRRQIIMP